MMSYPKYEDVRGKTTQKHNRRDEINVGFIHQKKLKAGTKT